MLRSLIVTLALVVGSIAIAGPKVDDAALSALSADARTNLVDPRTPWRPLSPTSRALKPPWRPPRPPRPPPRPLAPTPKTTSRPPRTTRTPPMAR
ncbi:MAG: hypothetical protein IPI35_33910 [Deltaproteobacteria bacterium]|nr:hypothetical protein [Deltaproteobacteria bacterium]